MWIVVAGNPMDGMNFWGPFPTSEVANDWADVHCKNIDWWSVEVGHPDSLE